MPFASTNCVGRGPGGVLETIVVGPFHSVVLAAVGALGLLSRHRCPFCTMGAPARPRSPRHLSVTLMGQPSTPRRTRASRGDAGQKRRVS